MMNSEIYLKFLFFFLDAETRMTTGAAKAAALCPAAKLYRHEDWFVFLLSYAQYRGPYAASEPETQALTAYFAAQPNIVAAVDVHSYGQLVLRPFAVKHPVDVYTIPSC